MRIPKTWLSAAFFLAAELVLPNAASAADTFSAVYVMSDNLGDKGFNDSAAGVSAKPRKKGCESSSSRLRPAVRSFGGRTSKRPRTAAPGASSSPGPACTIIWPRSPRNIQTRSGLLRRRAQAAERPMLLILSPVVGPGKPLQCATSVGRLHINQTPQERQ